MSKKSHGTKIFGSQNYSKYEKVFLFYANFHISTQKNNHLKFRQIKNVTECKCDVIYGRVPRIPNWMGMGPLTENTRLDLDPFDKAEGSISGPLLETAGFSLGATPDFGTIHLLCTQAGGRLRVGLIMMILLKISTTPF